MDVRVQGIGDDALAVFDDDLTGLQEAESKLLYKERVSWYVVEDGLERFVVVEIGDAECVTGDLDALGRRQEVEGDEILAVSTELCVGRRGWRSEFASGDDQREWLDVLDGLDCQEGRVAVHPLNVFEHEYEWGGGGSLAQEEQDQVADHGASLGAGRVCDKVRFGDAQVGQQGIEQRQVWHPL